jgi:hypothetical protein
MSHSLPAFPVWARAARTPDAPLDAAQAGFQAGAGLALIGLALAAEALHQGAWLDRLALRAAAATLALADQPTDETTLRDAHHLTRPGDDPGPAGRTFAFWRRLSGRFAPLASPGEVLEAVHRLGVRPDAALAEALEAARILAESDQPPLAAAAAAVPADLRARPATTPLALWLADAVLARRLRWRVAVPLMALGLDRHTLRTDDTAWPTACARAYGRAAAAAYDLHGELGRRADTLHAVQGRLRSKRATAVVAALLASDALAPSRLPGGMTDRAGRRLFDRLTALGAVRELTGRPSFRLYGL